MVDYFAFLSRAVADLTTNTAEQRQAVYDRARAILDARVRDSKEPLSSSQIVTQTAALEVAIQRVEALAQGDVTPRPVEFEPIVRSDDAARPTAPARARGRWLYGVAALALVGSVVVLLAAGYQLTRRSPRLAETTSPSVNYVFLQQPVFYRSSHPAGTLIVDKAQYFLYLIRSNTVALRYGLGVGPECQDTAGLYRVGRKDPGPKALLFGTTYRIQATGAQDGIGRGTAAGCFALLGDDAIGIYDRTPVDERVIVMN
jgi:lipoprotein-anchoring transpeptidase ErfK/SrfK